MDERVGFEVQAPAGDLAECPSIAYAFTLGAESSATNGETGYRRRIEKRVNLIVSD
jgi:hypothetical protein